jgi:hypothetical protein
MISSFFFKNTFSIDYFNSSYLKKNYLKIYEINIFFNINILKQSKYIKKKINLNKKKSNLCKNKHLAPQKDIKFLQKNNLNLHGQFNYSSYKMD